MKLPGLLGSVLVIHGLIFSSGAENSCYDSNGNAKGCMPDFVNPTLNRTIEATNTCGLNGPQEFCVLNGYSKTCGQFCDANTPSQSHPASLMTDLDARFDPTWWQSESLFDRKEDWLSQDEQHVNLTLHLGKSFDVTYISLKFRSSRPKSFVIYKRTSEDADWEPYQFYDVYCEGMDSYQQNSKTGVTATCASDFSDISPLTGGRVQFSTLAGRYGLSKDFLEDWVTATDIRIVLTQMNTFGDEIFGDPEVLKSYYYAISDLQIGARCKCNGHASQCEEESGGKLVCACQHNTAGPDCSVCKPFYNDRPWARATDEDAMECLACDCNGKSDECYFDDVLYKETGHGGHCEKCRDHRQGFHCEQCLSGFYMDQTGECTCCSCNVTGSEGIQCDEQGMCPCKPGVEGPKCDRCAANYDDFRNSGCRKKKTVIDEVLNQSTDDDSENEDILDPWNDMIRFSIAKHQLEFQELYSELLANNVSLTYKDARKQAFSKLLPLYRETMIESFLHMVQWIELIKKDPMHRSIRRTAQRLKKGGAGEKEAWIEAARKRQKLFNKMLLARKPQHIN